MTIFIINVKKNSVGACMLMLFQYLKCICLIFIPKGKAVFKEKCLGFLVTTVFGSSVT